MPRVCTFNSAFHFVCGSREISFVPSLHRASTDALIRKTWTIWENDSYAWNTHTTSNYSENVIGVHFFVIFILMLDNDEWNRKLKWKFLKYGGIGKYLLQSLYTHYYCTLWQVNEKIKGDIGIVEKAGKQDCTLWANVPLTITPWPICDDGYSHIYWLNV